MSRLRLKADCGHSGIIWNRDVRDMYSATDKNVKQLSSFYEYASCAVCQVQHYGMKGSFYIKEVHLEYIWIILVYTNTKNSSATCTCILEN